MIRIPREIFSARTEEFTKWGGCTVRVRGRGPHHSHILGHGDFWISRTGGVSGWMKKGDHDSYSEREGNDDNLAAAAFPTHHHHHHHFF